VRAIHFSVLAVALFGASERARADDAKDIALLKKIIAGLEDDLAEKQKEIDAVTERVKAKEEDVAKLIASHKLLFEALRNDKGDTSSQLRAAPYRWEKNVLTARCDALVADLVLKITTVQREAVSDPNERDVLTKKVAALEQAADLKAHAAAKAEVDHQTAVATQTAALAEWRQRVAKAQVDADREYKASLNEVTKICAFRKRLEEQQDELKLDLARAKEKLKQLEKWPRPNRSAAGLVGSQESFEFCFQCIHQFLAAFGSGKHIQRHFHDL